MRGALLLAALLSAQSIEPCNDCILTRPHAPLSSAQTSQEASQTELLPSALTRSSLLNLFRRYFSKTCKLKRARSNRESCFISHTLADRSAVFLWNRCTKSACHSNRHKTTHFMSNINLLLFFPLEKLLFASLEGKWNLEKSERLSRAQLCLPLPQKPYLDIVDQVPATKERTEIEQGTIRGTDKWLLWFKASHFHPSANLSPTTLVIVPQ